VIADLLVPAVALIDWIVEYGHLEGYIWVAADPHPFGERSILRTVIDDQDFYVIDI
jgi:hypothetical protein